MKFQNFELDEFQEEAINVVNNKNSVVVSAPTGSGKTLIADYIIDKELKGKDKVIYTAPIKALSNQKFKDFCKQYGEDKIGLITGDIVINPGAQVLIMTTEVYRNMAIINDPLLNEVAYCIMDEIHFISDVERGHVWEESIIFSPMSIRFLFLSATIPNAEEFADWVESIKEHKVVVVDHDIRAVPLKIRFYDVELGITTLNKIKDQKELDSYPDYNDFHGRRGKFKRHSRKRVPPPDFTELVIELDSQQKLPCIYFVFSRAKTQDYGVKLAQKHNFLNPEERKEIVSFVGNQFRKISKEINSLKSTRMLRQCLAQGIGFHHAGLLPDVKHIVEKLFTRGLLKVLFATETFAVGVNMPAKTVCFDSLRKYTGTGFRYLNSKEFFQISGRAGRRGIDTEGLSISVIHRPTVEIGKVRSFTQKDTLPIQSQFKISYNTVLNMINMHNPEEIQEILKQNFYTFQELHGVQNSDKVLSSINARYNNLVKQLTNLGYVKDNSLTELGQFTTHIFADEIELSQIFGGKFDFELDSYHAALLIGAIVYEEKREVKYFKKFPSKKLEELRSVLKSHPVLRKNKWSKDLEKLTAILYPCYQQKTFIEILKNTNMLEGDLVRLLMQILDRLEQISRATHDEKIKDIVVSAKDMIKNCFEGMNMF